jgi:MFS family permease
MASVAKRTETDNQGNPFAEAPANRKLVTLIGVYVAALTTRLISTGMFTVLPMAVSDIGGETIYPLASTVGGLLGIIAMPLYGYLGARNPWLKRPLLQCSLLVGIVVLLVEATAPSMIVIIVASFFYGVVSASIFVIAYSMIRDMYDVKQAGIYLGFVGTLTSVGMLAGPALTGLVCDNLGWRFVYHIGWPLLLVSVVLIGFGVSVSREKTRAMANQSGNFDLLGATTLSLFLLGLILSLSLGSSLVPFGSLGNFLLLALAAGALVALILIIRRKGDRAIIPQTVLKDRNTVILAICNLLTTASGMALAFFMPSFVIRVMGGSALEGSLVTSIYAVMGIFVSPVLGRMIAKARNARGVFTGGMIVRVVLSFGLAFILTPQIPLGVIYVAVFLAGYYSAQHTVTFSTAPQIQIREDIRFLSNSVIQSGQNLGGSVGMAVFTMIMATYGLSEGITVAFIVAGALAAISLLLGQFLQKPDK